MTASSMRPDSGTSSPQRASEQRVVGSVDDTIGCKKCGHVGADLRFAVFPYAMSFLLVTIRRGSGGLYCSSCRRNEALKWGGLSMILGWWGVPWGPIYTLQSIGTALTGGRQDPMANQQLLVAIGLRLIEDGRRDEGLAALMASRQFVNDPSVDALIARVSASSGADAS